jgi:hypothetical protein
VFKNVEMKVHGNDYKPSDYIPALARWGVAYHAQVRFNETLSFPVLDFSAALGALKCYKFLILNGCVPTNHSFTLPDGMASNEEMLGFLRGYPVVT